MERITIYGNGPTQYYKINKEIIEVNKEGFPYEERTIATYEAGIIILNKDPEKLEKTLLTAMKELTKGGITQINYKKQNYLFNPETNKTAIIPELKKSNGALCVDCINYQKPFLNPENKEKINQMIRELY